MSIAALLSGAWWAQRLSGPAMQGLAIAAAVLAVLIGGAIGVAWLREDARQDEAMTWRAKLSAAEAAAERELALRVREAERIGQRRQTEREARHAQEKQELEALLAVANAAAAEAGQVARLPPPRGCYSPELLKRLNKL